MSQTEFTAEISILEIVMYDEQEIAEVLLEQHPHSEALRIGPEGNDNAVGLIDTLHYEAVAFDSLNQTLTFQCTVDDPEEGFEPWANDTEDETSTDVPAGVLLAEQVLLG